MRFRFFLFFFILYFFNIGILYSLNPLFFRDPIAILGFMIEKSNLYRYFIIQAYEITIFLFFSYFSFNFYLFLILKLFITYSLFFCDPIAILSSWSRNQIRILTLIFKLMWFQYFFFFNWIFFFFNTKILYRLNPLFFCDPIAILDSWSRYQIRVVALIFKLMWFRYFIFVFTFFFSFV